MFPSFFKSTLSRLLPLIVLLLPALAGASMEGQAPEKQILERADVLLKAKVKEVKVKDERCETQTTYNLEIISFYKGWLDRKMPLTFQVSAYHPRRADWFWQSDCPHVINIIPPKAKNLQPGAEVLASVESKPGGKVFVTGTWDTTRQDVIKMTLELASPDTYESLPDTHVSAYETVVTANVFSSRGVGVGGVMPETVKALRELIQLPTAFELMEDLATNATPPGRLFGLCGMKHLSHPHYAEQLEKMAQTQDMITVQNGCLSMEQNTSAMLSAGPSRTGFEELCLSLLR